MLLVLGPSTGRVIVRLTKGEGGVVVEACSPEAKDEVLSMLRDEVGVGALDRIASELQREFGFVTKISDDSECELVNNACHHDRSPRLADQEV